MMKVELSMVLKLKPAKFHQKLRNKQSLMKLMCVITASDKQLKPKNTLVRERERARASERAGLHGDGVDLRGTRTRTHSLRTR